MISNVAFKVSLFQLSAMYVSIHFTCLFSLFNYSHRKYHLQTAVFSLLCTLKERPKERIFINIFYTILFCVFTLKQSSGGEVGDWRESIWYLHTWSISIFDTKVLCLFIWGGLGFIFSFSLQYRLLERKVLRMDYICAKFVQIYGAWYFNFHEYFKRTRGILRYVITDSL